ERLDGADVDAGSVHRADDPRDALVLRRVRIGPNEELLVFGDLAEAGPDLLPGDDELVTVDGRTRLQRREIGARVRLRESLTPHDVAAEDARQVEALLLFGSA